MSGIGSQAETKMVRAVRPAAMPELERDIDHNVLAAVERVLDSRRRRIGSAAPRTQFTAELEFGRRLAAEVQRHLDEVAARAGEAGGEARAFAAHAKTPSTSKA